MPLSVPFASRHGTGPGLTSKTWDGTFSNELHFIETYCTGLQHSFLMLHHLTSAVSCNNFILSVCNCDTKKYAQMKGKCMRQAHIHTTLVFSEAQQCHCSQNPGVCTCSYKYWRCLLYEESSNLLHLLQLQL